MQFKVAAALGGTQEFGQLISLSCAIIAKSNQQATNISHCFSPQWKLFCHSPYCPCSHTSLMSCAANPPPLHAAPLLNIKLKINTIMARQSHIAAAHKGQDRGDMQMA